MNTAAVEIRCPSCGRSIPVTEVLRKQIAEECEFELKASFASEADAIARRESVADERDRVLAERETRLVEEVQRGIAAGQSALEKKVRLEARQEARAEVADLRASAAAKDEELDRLLRDEQEWRKEKHGLLERQKALELGVEEQVQERVTAERTTIEERAAAAAVERTRAALEIELTDLRAATADKDTHLRQARELELNLRREKREVEDAKQALELEVVRQLDQERASIRTAALSEADEAHRLRDAEKDRKLQDALRVNDELRRKLQQGSQQIQGDVLEASLENVLKAHFPFDSIEPVAKGVRGADVLQRVYTRTGHFCGAILWESKNTKNWNETWIDKVKDDQREAHADVAVIVSATLPREVIGCALRDDVWLAETRLILGLATALRNGLVEVAVAKRAAAGKNEAVEVLFGYLTGPEFRQRVEAIVRTFTDMQSDLDEEKRVTTRRWAKRDKQIARVIESTGGMYGDLQGLLGTSLETIPALDTDDCRRQLSAGAASETHATSVKSADDGARH